MSADELVGEGGLGGSPKCPHGENTEGAGAVRSGGTFAQSLK